MLEVHPTKHGTGVEFIGTYNDLASLYDTMTKLSMTNIEFLSEDERLLTIIPYDLRHAFQGDREVYKNNLTFGFKTNWITLYNRMFTPSSELYSAHQNRPCKPIGF